MTSAGVLVLGMHRSGTSALAKLLSAGGLDPGARVIGGSEGNHEGHWEDACAVELHDHLLSEFGGAWDEPATLPQGWETSQAAANARAAIHAYLTNDRVRQPGWLLKDPRTCLFADLWAGQAASLGVPLGAVLLLRHPWEVAASLTARDGISPQRGLWLWLEYTLAAAASAAKLPHAVLGYDLLVADWRACMRLMGNLPAVSQIDVEARGEALSRVMDGGLRHHEAAQSSLPEPIQAVWEALVGCVGGRLDPDMIDGLSRSYRSTYPIVQPLAADWRGRHQQLWRRVARAEGLVSDAASEDRPRVELLRELVELRSGDVIRAFSENIQGMQESTAAAIDAHARIAGEYAELKRSSQLQASAFDRQALELQASNERSAALQASVSAYAARQQALESTQQALESAQQALEALLADAEVRLGEQARSIEAATKSEDELRREVARLRNDNAHLQDASSQLDAVFRSRSWRWTRPLRVAMRLVGGRWSDEDRRKLRALLPDRAKGSVGARAGLAAGQPAAQAIVAGTPADAVIAVPAVDGMADVFVWAVIDWHFRTQRPQHLARALAQKGHRVFYVSNNFVDSSEPGFDYETLDAEGRLYQVNLNLKGKPAIYFGMPGQDQDIQLRASFAALLGWTGTRSALSLVQHPFWSSLATSCPNARLVYDCMDHHAGFDNNATAVLAAEQQLIAGADMVIATSDVLADGLRQDARSLEVVRNGCDYAFFSRRPDKVYRQPQGRKVIGYFGAIAEWFDIDMVRAVALAHPEAEVLLIGSDTAGCAEALSGLANVRMVGEVPYAELPYWLHGFDACMLPFKVLPLTLATNPVKVYEYLAAGKPVVAVDLPEMAQFGDLVDVAGDTQSFVAAVGRMLETADGCADERRMFASGQTWLHRADALDRAVASIPEPRVSVIVLTYNNWELTAACLHSIESNSDYRNLEVVVVDNASSDGSRERLAAWRDLPSAHGHRKLLVLNDANAGFAAGNNIGLAVATGEYLVLLNNDTYCTPGWVRTLCRHLEADSGLGMVGPVTNNIGNEAKIDVAYADMAGMIEVAGRYTRAHPGLSHPMRTLAFFCVAMPRHVYARLGGLDEGYGMGFFEDDDYCRRVEQAGWRLACAEDVFIHHHLSASFNQLKSSTRQELFERNKRLYESKWGEWQPHRYRGAGDAAEPAPPVDASPAAR